MNKRVLAGLIAGAVVAVLVSVRQPARVPPAAMPSAMPAAQEFTLPDLAGTPHRLEEYRKRGPVMLVFSTTWCPNCLREIPTLKRIYREYAPKGLQLVAVNVGLMDSFEKAQAYALKHRLPYPVLYDQDAVIATRYGVTAFPRMFLISSNGTLAAAATPITDEILNTLLISKE